MEVIDVDCFTNPFYPGRNETKFEFHSYISDDIEQYACDSHIHMINLFRKSVGFIILVSGV